MGVHTVLRRRVAAVALTVVVGLGLAACGVPDTSPGPADPFKVSMLALLNGDRTSHGVPALTSSPKLEILAQFWAQNLANTGYLHHQDLNAALSDEPFTYYQTLGENILVGPPGTTPAQMEAAWWGSAAHRANILNGSFNLVGFGVVVGPDGRIWAVQDYGGI